MGWFIFMTMYLEHSDQPGYAQSHTSACLHVQMGLFLSSCTEKILIVFAIHGAEDLRCN